MILIYALEVHLSPHYGKPAGFALMPSPIFDSCFTDLLCVADEKIEESDNNVICAVRENCRFEITYCKMVINRGGAAI